MTGYDMNTGEPLPDFHAVIVDKLDKAAAFTDVKAPDIYVDSCIYLDVSVDAGSPYVEVRCRTEGDTCELTLAVEQAEELICALRGAITIALGNESN